MDCRAQTSMEYILIIGGALLAVIITIMLMRNQITPNVRNTVNGSMKNYTAIIGSFNSTIQQ